MTVSEYTRRVSYGKTILEISLWNNPSPPSTEILHMMALQLKRRGTAATSPTVLSCGRSKYTGLASAGTHQYVARPSVYCPRETTRV